ncbi:neuropeptide Y receptor type 6-like isoform X1 [Dendronephthya gigantea]|uniref:neuropeptide Y receptor type 6-like isoform X1 n=1 Tax=Dendronephthya gigantea TaxID=151771 RepID=UPI00106B970C|nr:neuropeptide Y receptor type 6-like isoform X1 [Dendronephthya gigantea]XP_028392923.1 neuropeptide Y receptor type 6-like isoform X1 [Dendronephthya gigantea]XP_028392924.1 neuropeptide Y receptor type 6-like isoform X1 [Dendronephthya gigantea]XP_028392925.1 neuropeptide Y receptor type 6-like isoform X1 [Dendronephthya gigantea]XP_028392926.1 neuropeptide Y receptor type 6-like isoform X1 [Dendronephthya gigantea]XP_028392927.1 neuropeptide Y receptor type 6-like isoform X1 [Dendronephth
MSNFSSTSGITLEPSETTKIINIFNYLLYTLILVLGVPGNILVVWSLLSVRKEKVNKSYKILVINLAISDIVVVLATCPFQIAELILLTFPFGRAMCSILWPLQTASYGAGVYNMVSLNVHRYYVISYPTSSRALGRITCFAVALCWMVPTLITALPYAINLQYTPEESLCEETWGDHTAHSYTIYLFSVQYILPLFVIATLNLLTIRRLKRRYMFRVNCARLSDDNLQAHKRIVKMLLFIIVIFALFGLPGQIMWLLPAITEIKDDSDYLSIRSLVDIFNFMYCVLNPVLFFTYNKECFDRLKKFLASLFSCCVKYHWEISSPIGTSRHDAVTNLLPASRTSYSQDTSGSDAPRADSRYAPALPKCLLAKLDEGSSKGTADKVDKQVPDALYSSLTGLYTPVVSCHGSSDVEKRTKSSSQIVKVAGDEEIFRGSFVELLRTRNITNDLMKCLEQSPETAIVEEGVLETGHHVL